MSARSYRNKSQVGNLQINSSDVEAVLEEQEWYHGVLPREEAKRLLNKDGDFLVRESKNKKTSEVQYVLSTFWNGHKHFIIQYGEGGWRFEGDSYPTIPELVTVQYKSGTIVTAKSQCILSNPIIKELCQLNNDDIALEMKIGNDKMASWDKKLLTAAKKGNIKEVELCIKNGARLKITDDDDIRGWTPLMWAAWGGHLEVVTYLVTQGSQLEVTDVNGKTALHYAARNGYIDVTKCLIDQGCSPWVKTKQIQSIAAA